MIRLLREEDRAAALALLATAPQLTLYMWGNLETLGFTRDFCEFWGDVTEETPGTYCLNAVLNRYMTGWSVYGKPNADWQGLGQVLDTHLAGAVRLQDNPGGIASFLPYLHCYRGEQIKIEELMNLPEENFRPVTPPIDVTVRRATMDDLPALTKFYAVAQEMARPPAAIIRPLQDSRLWLAEKAGNVLATALTNAEIRQMAMIGGVFTAPSARGRGLSQAVCSALCRELFAEGKQPALYWANPTAGAVYRKLGFCPIGHWRSVWLEPTSSLT
ncbi:MAG: GNAT family N-acetyltransferase [Chloroflexi bacterium]|nr:GNAT family N-acetyltransferase [Chloroflexota bacterium]